MEILNRWYQYKVWTLNLAFHIGYKMDSFVVAWKIYKYLTGNSSGYWLIYLISVELLTERAEQEITSAKDLTLVWGCAPAIHRERAQGGGVTYP
jgi:hypothetical protein